MGIGAEPKSQGPRRLIFEKIIKTPVTFLTFSRPECGEECFWKIRLCTFFRAAVAERPVRDRLGMIRFLHAEGFALSVWRKG